MTLAWCYLRAVKGVFISPWLFQENYVKCFGNARVINEMNANSNFQRIQSEKDIDEFRRRLSNQRKKNVSHIWFADYMIQTILYNHRQPFVIGICIPITHLCLTVDKGWTFRDFGARSRYLAGIINCIPQKLWDVITFPCLRYLLLAPKSSYHQYIFKHRTFQFCGHLSSMD